MKRGHRFLATSLRALAGVAAGGRVIARRDLRRPDPESGEHLGAVRGEPDRIPGPGSSTLYAEIFPGPRPGAIVFTHGWCLTEAAWHYQKRDLAGRGPSVVTWDLPGHGYSSSIPPDHLSLDAAVAALDRVVERYRDDGGILLVGHSLGGVVTLRYLAAASEACRGSVRGAVLVSTPMMHFASSVADGWPGARLEARAIRMLMRAAVESERLDRRLAGEAGVAEANRLSYRIARVGFGRDPSPAQVRFVRDMIASISPEVRRASYRAMSEYDMRALLPDIRVPVLVVIGERDRLVNPAESMVMAETLPRGRALALPGVGHAAFLETHERFNAEVRRFADRVLRARPVRPTGTGPA